MKGRQKDNTYGVETIVKTFRLRKHRKYLETDHFFADIAVKNANYTGNAFYTLFLESMNIPVSLRLSIRKTGGKDQGKFLKRLIADRKAEYRISGDYLNGNASLKRQISDLERMQKDLFTEGSALLDASLSVRVYADHPAVLRDRVWRIRGAMEMLGFEIEQVAYSRRDLMHILKPSFTRARYLMNSKDVSRIVPIFRDDSGTSGGVVIGVDDFSERFVYYDPFAQTSYNSIVLGETGSGKSYFTKLLLMRALASGLAERVLVFDPLDEYSCGILGGNCITTSVSEFAYSHAVNSGEFGDNHDLSTAKILIIKARPGDSDNHELLQQMLRSLNILMTLNPSQRKIIAVDECHILLRNQRTSDILGSMVRHSRHYSTAIVNISQNVDDFLNGKIDNVAYNSNRVFIFRTRNLKDSHKKALKLEGFDFDPPERLIGGNTFGHSECLVSDGNYCRKIRVYSSREEDELLQRA